MNNKQLIIISISLTLCLHLSVGVGASFEFSTDLNVEEIWEQWLEPGAYFTMLSPEGELILETARQIHIDDEYLAADNTLYRVTSIDQDNNIAYTEMVAEIKLSDDRLSLTSLREQLGLSIVEAQEDHTGIIAIYHTHNAESYIPTDGTDSINGIGGIHTVGASFAEALNELDIETNYSEELHLPHDRGAYRRSRNTVLELLASDPDAIFDVHRDAAPPHAYAAEIGEELVTQVQFVVGRQNQNLGINRQYAQSLKALADQIYPGLVKGIFYASGNYNQDLTPLNLLLEVGAHTNSRDAAARGISLFAEVVDLYFYGHRDQRDDLNFDTEASSSALRTVFWIIIFLIATGLVMYVINAGGWRAALERIKRK